MQSQAPRPSPGQPWTRLELGLSREWPTCDPESWSRPLQSVWVPGKKSASYSLSNRK